MTLQVRNVSTKIVIDAEALSASMAEGDDQEHESVKAPTAFISI